jgi:hypothetical protein
MGGNTMERKRIAGGLLALVLLGCPWRIFGEASIEITTPDPVVEKGNSIQVGVTLSGMGANSYCLNSALLKFEKDKVNFTKQETGGAAKVFVPDSRGLDQIQSSGEVRAAGACDPSGGMMANQSGDGILAKFSFEATGYGLAKFSTQAKTAHTFGTALITVEKNTIQPVLGAEKAVAITGLGDADVDGTVHVIDLLQYAERIGVKTGEPLYTTRFDGDKDGQVTVTDMMGAGAMLRTAYFK